VGFCLAGAGASVQKTSRAITTQNTTQIDSQERIAKGRAAANRLACTADFLDIFGNATLRRASIGPPVH
jgi:hypothetical protein